MLSKPRPTLKKKSGPKPGGDGDYGGFLYSFVTSSSGDEATVLSILARTGDDPWHVARQLAAMPKTRAVAYLAHIVNRPGLADPFYDPGELRTWIDRLPRQSRLPRFWGRPSLTHMFFGFNALFFVLLCLSLAAPLPPRNLHGGTRSASSRTLGQR